MAEPPLDAGAVHETVAWVLPRVAEGDCGASGTVAGVTGEVVAGIESLTSLVATTLVFLYPAP